MRQNMRIYKKGERELIIYTPDLQKLAKLAIMNPLVLDAHGKMLAPSNYKSPTMPNMQ